MGKLEDAIAKGLAKEAEANGVSEARLWLPFPPSTNALYANRKAPRGGQRGRVKTSAYMAWIDRANHALLGQRPLKFVWARKYRITYEFDRTGKRGKIDATNFVKAAEDQLVRAGIIRDDSYVWESVCRWVYNDLAPGTVQIHVEKVR